jgi:hypothetical protein
MQEELIRPMKLMRQPQQVELGAWRVGATGAVGILTARSLGLICSQRHPGDVILKTNDVARLVRGSGIAVVSGFHSPIKKDCLPILLRGSDPIIDAGRLHGSRFSGRGQACPAELAAKRNRFVAVIADPNHLRASVAIQHIVKSR